MMEHLQPDNTTGVVVTCQYTYLMWRSSILPMQLFVSNTAETNQFILVNSRYPVSSPDNW